jgi:hypothetical protein
MYFPDLTPYEYGPTEPQPNVLNVGWLSVAQAFPVGIPDKRLVPALERLIASPVNLYRGWHFCEFCQDPAKTGSPAGLSHMEKREAQSTLVKNTFKKRRSTFAVRFRFVLDPILLLVSAAQAHHRLRHGRDSAFPYAKALGSPGRIHILDPAARTMGNGEIRVTSAAGITYVAPVLVLHYVVAHGYLPPQEFIDAVIELSAT